MFYLTCMGLFDQLVVGVLTSVISALILEYIRELRSSGFQPLEKLTGLVVRALKALAKGVWAFVCWLADIVSLVSKK
jgi:hypothetical protein